MQKQFIRTDMVIGTKNREHLMDCTVLVFGLGGVGGYVCEALCRSGIGKFLLVDDDEVAFSNLNRQIIATRDTIGKKKTEVMKERIKSINPDAEVITYEVFVGADNLEQFFTEKVDYIVDAIDTVTAKIAIAIEAEERNIPLISSMGTGNKLNPMGFIVTDIYKTEMCPLCKVMRRELKKRGVKKLKVVYSKEQPRTPIQIEVEEKNKEASPRSKRVTPGSMPFVPGAAGLLIASEVVKGLIEL